MNIQHFILYAYHAKRWVYIRLYTRIIRTVDCFCNGMYWCNYFDLKCLDPKSVWWNRWYHSDSNMIDMIDSLCVVVWQPETMLFPYQKWRRHAHIAHVFYKTWKCSTPITHARRKKQHHKHILCVDERRNLEQKMQIWTSMHMCVSGYVHSCICAYMCICLCICMKWYFLGGSKHIKRTHFTILHTLAYFCRVVLSQHLTFHAWVRKIKCTSRYMKQIH